ncbi:NifB/NifX family molybdenum-iron cluster-binding protein [Saccharicrinis aurantiacus]|uniref:NifB/NifX family molybdenum-iron cluster-binding protein n=1 Tax=Saccharicrinis aurantiacus TaxID=1849719 RepID=UPI0024907000|nr:hypothetical protein [Saccharicrinis aurantiacus]
MKLCIPILGEKGLSKELLANDFYKANHYCITDISKNSSEVYTLDTSNTIYLSMSELKKLEIKAIITPNLRPMAAKILFENEIEVYQSLGNVVEENINFFKKGTLKDFTEAMIEQKSSCSSDSCSSCSSSSCG